MSAYTYLLIYMLFVFTTTTHYFKLMDKERLMALAIDLAARNVQLGGGPFGAVIADKEGRVIATGANSVTLTLDPTAHAEVNAIRHACQVLHTFTLRGYELYTSCEPCPMCLSAIYWARLDKVYYACTQNDARDAGFDDSYIYRELALSPDRRALSVERLMRAQAQTVFRTWKSKEDKIEY